MLSSILNARVTKKKKKKSTAPGPGCGIRPLVSVELLPSSQSRLKTSPFQLISSQQSAAHHSSNMDGGGGVTSWRFNAAQIGNRCEEMERLFFARAALVVPPLGLNKLHYPGCQSGGNIIHSGLSSQAHSNTPSSSICSCSSFQIRILNHPSIYFFFLTTFSPQQIKCTRGRSSC